jgi:two-component system nitrate/nitrite response regulator NarL
VIATRHEIAAAGIAALLCGGGHRVVACCSHEDDLLRSSKAHRPNIIIVAENVVGHETVKSVLRLRDTSDSVAIIFLLEQRHTINAADLLSLDVEGLLLSEAPARSFVDCVESVSHGRKWIDPDLLHHLAMAERPLQSAGSLTLREGDVANLVSLGMRNKEIARNLHLSEGTVKMHLHHIYEKLRVGGRTRLAVSLTGACAGVPISGVEIRLAEESGGPDSAPTERVNGAT